MNRWIPLFSLGIAFFSVPSATRAEEGFTTLFNGKDLSGWQIGPDNAWVVREGTLTVAREFDGAEHNSDYLWTRETYDDFILKLEYKLADNTNSGVFLRTADPMDPVYTGIEIQVANSFNRDGLSRTGTAGAVYDCQAPSANTVKPPGEWNACTITCDGALLKVELNGQQIVEMNLDDWTKAHENPDGSANKFATPLKDFARSGLIGLQDHGRPVWYRNIRVKRLEADTKP